MAQQIDTTLGALAEAQPALQRLGALSLPAKPAYHLSKLIRLVNAAMESYSDVRNKLVTKYGTPVAETPGMFTFTAENGDAFTKEVRALNAEPVTIAWSPISLDAWGDVNVSPGDLAALGPLLADSFQ